jgi:membrane protein
MAGLCQHRRPPHPSAGCRHDLLQHSCDLPGSGRPRLAIYGIFTDPGSIAKHLDDIAGFVPGSAIDVAREQLMRMSSKGDRTLGLTFAVGLVISLWSANAAMKALFDTLNIVYGEHEKRGFLKLNAISLSFTVAAIGFVLSALAAVVAVPF